MTAALPPATVALLDQDAAFWEEALDDAIDQLRGDLASHQSDIEQMVAVHNTTRRLATAQPPAVIASLLMTALLRLARQTAVAP